MKKLISLLIVLTLCFSVSTAVFAEKPIDIRIGGNILETTVKPILVDGRTMLPVRAVFEALGAKVDYIAKERKVVATKGDWVVSFIIGSKIMTVNGAEKEIDVPAMIVDSRTLAPVRACAEAFDLEVEWNANTRTVIIRKPVTVLSERYTVVDNVIITYDYDERGNKILEDRPGVVTKKFKYDENDNLIREEHSNGFAATFTYNEMGKPLTYSDTKGVTMKYEHDENGNLTYYETNTGAWQKATYDENGNMLTYSDSNGNDQTLVYDINNRLITRTFSSGAWMRYGYDDYGNLTFQQDSSFAWIKTTYNENGQKVRVAKRSGEVIGK